MTTWTQVGNQSTEFNSPSDEENDYVVSGYMANGYIDGALIWADVDVVTTTWTAA